MPKTAVRKRINKQALFADLGYEPHPGQLEIHLCDAPRRIVACGARWGKTTAAAMEGLAAALAPAERSVGWVVAPTYDLADRVFREIQYVAARHIPHRIVTMKDHERRIVLRNMAGGTSEIRGKSSDNPVSLLGEGLDWLVIDEAARMKPTIWQGRPPSRARRSRQQSASSYSPRAQWPRASSSRMSLVSVTTTPPRSRRASSAPAQRGRSRAARRSPPWRFAPSYRPRSRQGKPAAGR